MNVQEWDNHWTANADKYLRMPDLAHLRPILKPLLKGKIADLGCGVTDLYVPGDDVTGLDISPACVKVMQERYPFGNWVVGDVRNTELPDSTFDTVVSSHVLEHFHDQAPILAEMKRIAKPGGNIIIVVPRRSIGPDHVHPKWFPVKIEERITAHLHDARYELVARNHWLIQGKKTASATVVMIAWSPDEHRLVLMNGCLQKLQICTKYPHQLVIVDNGPVAQTELVKAVGPDIHIVNKVLHNPPASRNQGAGVGRSDFIAFIDNDMEVYEDWLADSISLLQKYPNEKLIVVPTDCPLMRRPENLAGSLNDCFLSKVAGSGCWVMRRKSFEEIGKWDEYCSVEDHDYSVRAQLLGYKFIYREGPKVKHRAWHKRTFKSTERFIDGRWLPDPSDKRGMEQYKRSLLLEYAQKYGTKVFVETGTYKGDTVKTMLVSGWFRQIWSVDVDPNRAAAAQKRFGSFPFIHCEKGDSAQWLPGVLTQIHEPALFWLDAHGSTVQAEKGTPTPIVAELRAILEHPYEHVILIDDVRYYEGDIPNYPTLGELEMMVKERLPNHVFTVEGDIIRCHPLR